MLRRSLVQFLISLFIVACDRRGKDNSFRFLRFSYWKISEWQNCAAREFSSRNFGAIRCSLVDCAYLQKFMFFCGECKKCNLDRKLFYILNIITSTIFRVFYMFPSIARFLRVFIFLIFRKFSVRVLVISIHWKIVTNKIHTWIYKRSLDAQSMITCCT